MVCGFLWRWLKACLHPWPRYRRHPEWIAEDAWYAHYQALDNEAVKIAAEYAQRRHVESTARYDAQDRKIEWCFGLAAAGLALLFAFPDRLRVQPLACVPSLVCFVLSMAMSLWARLPGIYATSLTVRNALEHDPKTVAARIAASQHCAIKAQQIVISWKTDHLQGSVVLFVLGLLLLFIPFVSRRAAPVGDPPRPATSSGTSHRLCIRPSMAGAEAEAEVVAAMFPRVLARPAAVLMDGVSSVGSVPDRVSFACSPYFKK